MKVKSKIKSIFDKEMRHYIAAICDTRQIQNNILKMDLLQRLLTTRSTPSEQIGGATNRYVVMIDGYAIKIAVDRQGFKDNLMEYALTMEVPHTTKSYETNGYILIQQCVRLLTLEEWRVRKVEILKILDELGRDYLLGDVGYDDVNRTNWGVTDDGELVILDYAYCHRLTEDLFTCPVCGSVLSYDQNFTSFLCTDRANCHARYSYNQIKARQGDAVDWNMIKEKKERSLVIPPDQDSIEVDRSSDLLIDSSTFVIRSYSDMARYKEVKNMLHLDYRNPEVMDLITKLTFAKARPVPNVGEIAELEDQLDKFSKDVPEVKCIIDPEFETAMMERDGYVSPEWSSTPADEQSDDEDLSMTPFEALMAKLNESKATETQEEPIAYTEPQDCVYEGSEDGNNDPFKELMHQLQPQENVTIGGNTVDEPDYTNLGVGADGDPVVLDQTPDLSMPVDESTNSEETVVCDTADEGIQEAVVDETESDEEEANDQDEPEVDTTATVTEEVDADDQDDVIGEPDSELEDAVEDDLPQPPEEEPQEDSFTTEPVTEFDEDGADESTIPISLTGTDLEDAVDPEKVVIDGSYIADDGQEEGDDVDE